MSDVRMRSATLTILATETESDEVVINGAVVALQMPAAWDTANLTVEERVADVGGTESALLDVYDAAGAQRTIVADAGRLIRFSPSDWIGVRKLKLTSTATQTATRTIKAWFREFG